MKHSIIDSHIHFDQYSESTRSTILKELPEYKVEALISVSTNLVSAQKNLALAEVDERIKPAFGFHPEQELPSDWEVNQLCSFLNEHKNQMVAIGEVGLPYYLLREHPEIKVEPYLEMLEIFVKQASELNKPISLHAVYDDAPVVCDLLEKYSVTKAHFHWFKGDERTVQRMIQNGYYISITPDCLYETEIQQLIKAYPLANMMVETDGPWPFGGPFQDTVTHPKMIHDSVQQIAEIKRVQVEKVYVELYKNTKKFYGL
ncbi:TatD family hydrolase [Peribacillus loiseleuriae]|uniref:DNAase n=1 Tax=Peribacillus loiseleuriae TaxID=1679170 RepID=A0A0K9GNR1_9BACI|nr:TatD family hydrolase [Peribacillus loiseleuriae]KMY48290.1 DNAase [Peribacillus loiseleuriae]